MHALERLLETLAAGGARFVTMEEAARAYDRRSPFAPA
jgi:hypothetical protein